MAKIVIDARESGTSTGRYIDKLIEYLHKINSEHSVFVLTKIDRLDYLQSIAPKFNVVAATYKEFTFGEQFGLLRQLKKLKPDLVHFGMVQQPAFYRGRVVTTMHDLTTTRFRNPAKNVLIFSLKQLVYKWLNRRVARKSDHIIVPSEFVKQDVAQYASIPPAKITVTYEAADKISEKPEEAGGLAGKRFIMYVGRPQPHKNLKRLIDAFAILKKHHPDLHLVIAGKKDTLMDKLEHYTNMKGITDVLFTGFVSEGQLRWLYEHTAAYVFPSLSEGFGLPGLEAMVHGAPVVSSNATCLPEVYGDAAHYFDPTDVVGMANAISKVLSEKKLRNELIAKGKRQAAKYSWETTALLTFDIYNKVLEN